MVVVLFVLFVSSLVFQGMFSLLCSYGTLMVETTCTPPFHTERIARVELYGNALNSEKSGLPVKRFDILTKGDGDFLYISNIWVLHVKKNLSNFALGKEHP